VSQLTITLIQLGFLALLWLMVLSVVSVMRNDLFTRRRARATKPTPVAPPVAASAVKPAKPRPDKPAKPKRNAPRHLVVTAGSHEGTTIELGATPITIGRAPENTLALDDDYCSGRHARLYPHEGTWVVEDLGSTNGTYLGKARLTQPSVVPPGTAIRIGKTVLELRK
jgi:pSer/pThr/pTyr-binding forkhead associated (FHA) protein